MANPVTHIIIPMLIAETYRRYFAKKGFSKWYVFLAGFFGGAPDFDLLIGLLPGHYWDLSMHRSFTHTLLIPIATALIGIIIYLLMKKKILKGEQYRISCIVLAMISIGISLHVLLDGFDGMTNWFYPLSITINLPNLIVDKFRAGFIDAILMFTWLLYQEELFNDILRFLRIKKA
jgi:hypothetical protein